MVAKLLVEGSHLLRGEAGVVVLVRGLAGLGVLGVDRLKCFLDDLVGVGLAGLLIVGLLTRLATTLEGLGSLGRGEGIACQAVCLLEPREAS